MFIFFLCIDKPQAVTRQDSPPPPPLCTEDRFFPAEFMRRVAWPSASASVPDEIAAGHCVALSRPYDLANLLDSYVPCSREMSMEARHKPFCGSALWLPLFDELFRTRVAVARLAAEAEEADWHGIFVWDHLRWQAPVRQAG